MPRVLSLLLAVALLAGCGGSSKAESDGLAHLDFGYPDASSAYVDHGRVNHDYPIAVHDVSFRSGAGTVRGFLLLPPQGPPRPAVVFVHGSGGDRTQLLTPAAWLAARGFVTMTLTAPSTSDPLPQPTSLTAFLRQQRQLVVRDVVAVRRAVDVLQGLKSVDGDRIGYVGWSSGAKLGTYLGASDDRFKALALLSAGADPLASFVAHAPAAAKAQVRSELGAVDPLRYIAWAKADELLLEDGRKDEVVPAAALKNMIRAAPEGTTVRWYPARHELGAKAYLDAFDWLADRLGADGRPIPGARTGP